MKRFFAVVLFCALSAGAYAQQKYALVIGNAAYTAASPLQNTINDADDMEAVLKSNGWTVQKVLNGTLEQMEEAVRELKRRLSRSSDSYGLFFYSGHGIQSSNRENYMIPVNAVIENENYLNNRSMSLQTTLRELNDAGNALNVVILDACRNNPFKWWKTGVPGLSAVRSPPADFIIVYATSEDSVASDGYARNSPFTEQLLNNLRIPGLEAHEVFRRTGAAVIQSTGGSQRPSIVDNFFGLAYLGIAVQPAPSPQPAPQPIPAGLEWKAEGSGVTITKYTGDASVVNIPERIQGLPVAAIGDYAFDNRHRLTSVTIPASVTSIGNVAFWGCDGLTAITVDPRNTAYSGINGVVFDKAGKTLIRYPEGKIGTYTIPSSVTSIGDNAFNNCSGLTSVTILSSITSIGDNAFAYCSGLMSVTIPSSITSIGKMAFAYCYGLTSVTIPPSVTSIGEEAFRTCKKLTSVTIPASVTSISYTAFFQCTGLTAITVDPRNTAYTSINGVLFDKTGKKLIQYPAGKTDTAYTIPTGVISIDWGAFNECKGLTSVTIPASVTYIDGAFWYCDGLTSVTIPPSVTYIRYDAFNGCKGLTAITVDPRNTAYTSTNGVLFDKTGKTLVQYPGGKTGAYTIPAGVTSIGQEAFNECRKLTSVTIPASVTSIGEGAFSWCGLTSVVIPPSVTSIGRYAFGACFNLTSVTLSRYTLVAGNTFPDSAQIRYSD